MTSPTGAFRALSRSWDGTALELKRFEEAVTIQTELEKSGIQVRDDRRVTTWSLEPKGRPQKPS